MTAFCTYVYRDPKTGVVRYVGEGRADRPFDHIKKKYPSQLSRMIRKRMQEGFTIAPYIIPAASKEDCQEMEMLLIAMIGRKDLGLGPLFNLTDGGDGKTGIEWTDEQRAKQSASQIKRYLKPGAIESHATAQREAHKRMSAETKRLKDQKISAALSASCASRFKCTVDGETFFSSKEAMAAVLGTGKQGTRSPTFRYVK